MNIKLVRPQAKYARQIMAYKDEMIKNGDILTGCACLEDVTGFEEWVDFENRLKAKYGDGYVPSEVFLAVRISDDKLVGIMDYRHPLSPYLLQYGGNIGYSVLPSERRKGYATEMLKSILPICKEYGETRVLITCNKTNIVSRRTITKNGGILENEVQNGDHISQRYWITL